MELSERCLVERAVTIDWLIYTSGALELSGGSLQYTGEQAGFYGQFVYGSSGRPELSQEESFSGLDPAEIEGLPRSWHLKARFPKANAYIVAILMVPYPKAMPKQLFQFIDGQG